MLSCCSTCTCWPCCWPHLLLLLLLLPLVLMVERMLVELCDRQPPCGSTASACSCCRCPVLLLLPGQLRLQLLLLQGPAVVSEVTYLLLEG
jgi:hypothetical protein